MTLTKIKFAAMLTVAGLLSAGGVSAYQGAAVKSGPGGANQVKVKGKLVGATVAPEAGIDARLNRAEERLALAQHGLVLVNRGQTGMPMMADDITLWNRRVSDAKLDVRTLRQEHEGPKYELNEAKRLLEKAIKAEQSYAETIRSGGIDPEYLKLSLKYDVLAAQENVEKIERKQVDPQPGQIGSSPNSALSRTKPIPTADLARNKEIEEILEKILPINFGTETPLEDVIKYIKTETADSKGKSIPIYINPHGLQEVEKTTTSPVTLDIDGLPIRTTLRLMLEQLNLGYEVRDGMIQIDAASSIEERRDKERQATEAFGGGMGSGGMGGGGLQ